MAKEGQIKGAEGHVFKDGWAYIDITDKDGNTARIYVIGKDISVAGTNWTHSGGNSSDLGPDGEDTVHPRQEPQLLTKMDKDMPQKPKLRPDDGVSDPQPVKQGNTSEAQASKDSKAAGAAGTKAGIEIKWKFAGKKPGSEVTDPAEPQGTGADKPTDSAVKPIAELVTDPPEASKN
jgi:hypothetical protein